MTTSGATTPDPRELGSLELGSLEVARLLLDELLEQGVGHLLLSPGSRSAPLAYAAAEAESAGRLAVHVRIDERDAGFTALGLALASGAPVAVATTSGTAVGELLPAVMEADHAGVPLVVLSADRPAELHGTGANQTTRQSGIFGTHVRAEVGVPAGADPRTRLEPVLTALAGCGARGVGPVHVNVEFRDPLVPDDGDSLAGASRSRGTGSRTAAAPAVEPAAGRAAVRQPAVSAADLPRRRTVVVAGHGAGAEAERFARVLDLPLLAEPSSNARFGPNAIGPYRVLLGYFAGHGDAPAPSGERIERVVVFGRPTLSRPVARLLADARIPSALYVPDPVGWFEPGRRREAVIADLDELAAFAGAGPAWWLDAWRGAAELAEAAVEQVLEAERRGGLTGPDVARAVWEAALEQLVIGSSNAIRDADLWAPPAAGAGERRVYANRGLAGIDGTVATATGIATAGTSGPEGARTCLLVGDVTFLHDVGGLLLGDGEIEPPLDVVVLNDAGGAIFSTLEHGQVAAGGAYGDAVERLFGTPHRVRLEALAEAYGLDYAAVRTLEELRAVLAASPARPRRIIDVALLRDRVVERNGRITQALAAVLG
ncbi:2-succinyl-5-enolpyruvyl-6-hydroxy-3-cyclohexene-1-carboxylic-acid synthase [Zhihengliuella sp.]|uniref:2-succinyl-5-enolpyruvyl-6-hydroxy-3- cyclohexene-1-carboxylic-acid synthase n=1 Tax=Zhihengliuella sp. TaxID=1954483 RepID=UPI0028127841|nr:2-succinyl-5-enolpyruvyl-6-hydroxy-3-cyclohexene-1-carboxylic-acid synthase [Zhihengliuella sp.]